MGIFEGSDGGSDDGGIGFGEFGSNEGDMGNVMVVVLVVEVEFG